MIKELRIISPEGLANMLSELIRIIEGNIRMRSKFDEQLLELNHKMIEMKGMKIWEGITLKIHLVM